MKIDKRSVRSKDTYYYKDLAGKRFGQLTVIERCGTNNSGNVLWKCRCDCGNEKIVAGGKLTSGRATNCGCQTTEIKRRKASKHGITAGGKPRIFNVWNGMKARCYNVNNVSFKNYGARGIRVCSEWLVFENFYKWAMNNGYSDNLELDRIDVNGNYCPENCRFVTRKVNANNKRNNHFIEIDGEIKTFSEWIEILGLCKSTAYRKLKDSESDFVTYAKGKGQVYFINKLLEA